MPEVNIKKQWMSYDYAIQSACDIQMIKRNQLEVTGIELEYLGKSKLIKISNEIFYSKIRFSFFKYII